MKYTNSGQGSTQLKQAQEAANTTSTPLAARNVFAGHRPAEIRRGTLGVVFVHGIGGQARGETLLDWSGRIVRAVSRWAQAIRPAGQPLSDQVVRSEIDFEGDNVPFVTLNVPGLEATSDRPAFDDQTWVITEAWWAERVSPPPLSAVIDWCGRGGAVSRVVERTIKHLVPGGSPLFQALNKVGFGLFISVLTAIALLVYGIAAGLARVIPIAAVREAITRFQLDWFLMTSWGDVFLLLRDPTQAANVRGRLIQSIRALRAYGCDRIAVVAHSGGTIVAYTALSDGAFDDAVDSLITHGEAIALGRSIEPEVGEDGGVPPAIRLAPGARLRIGGANTLGRWTDFWSTHDPAPCGPLEPEFPMFDEGVVERRDWPGDAPGRSIRIWNRRSVLEDHGAYWDNDEEFLYPLLAQLEVAGRPDTDTRFRPTALPPVAVSSAVAEGRPSAAPDSWVARRRQRVHLLSLWGRLMFVVPLFAAVGEFVLPGGSLIEWLRNVALGAIGLVPPLLDLVETIVTFRLPPALHALATLIGSLGLALLVLGALVHAALPVGPADAWPEGSSWRRAVTAVDSLIALIARLLLIGAVVSFVPWLMGQGIRIPGPGPIVILIASAILVLIIASIGWPKAEPVRAVRAAIGASEGVAAAVLLGLVVVAMASVIYVAVAVESLRVWMVGTFMAFLAFRVLGAVGKWRWRVWDEHEREAFRALRPLPYPRGWPLVQAATLGATAVFAGVVVVGGIDALVPWVIVAVVALVLFCNLRDAAIAAHPIGGPVPASKPPAVPQASTGPEPAAEPPAST